ncbi:hypothetical protein [uncultured Holdemanella sp.]|uniref:hypothetical protein n=1 Tax=uncultured Holdemanella sp. TaxID=1763549 RepID=UPI0025F97DB1|nr:hypothetical protein [uncultured Holdemanella sp.]
MSATVANKDITLRMVHNKVSTAFTKAFLESDYVNQMVDSLYDEVDALKLASISLNYVYRHLEYNKYLNRYNQVRLMTKPGEKNTPIILAMNDSVFDFRAHTSLKKCAKYDTKDHKHEGLNVYKLIKDGKLEMANAKLSYSKASSKDVLKLIKETIRIWDVLFYQYDQIVKENEMNLALENIMPEPDQIVIYESDDEDNTKNNIIYNRKYSKTYLVRHYENTWPNDPYDKYKEVKDVLLALENEVRSRRKVDREER